MLMRSSYAVELWQSPWSGTVGSVLSIWSLPYFIVEGILTLEASKLSTHLGTERERERDP